MDSGADKSSAAANLAVVMAQAGDRVILVDGDLRRPQQHEIFGLSNQQGLSTWLGGGGDPPLQNSGIEGLQVLVAGPVSGNPVALLSAKRLGERLAVLRQRADYVLIDAPPVLAVTDAGPGFGPDAADKLFKPFFTTRATGTGLGLYVAQHIAMKHGGAVLAENLAQGGARFSIWLPLTHQP